jgi:uncharacterized membrane protein (Fun14 family)
VTQTIGTVELSIIFLSFFGVVTIEADTRSTPAASFINFTLRDIVAGVL